MTKTNNAKFDFYDDVWFKVLIAAISEQEECSIEVPMGVSGSDVMDIMLRLRNKNLRTEVSFKFSRANGTDMGGAIIMVFLLGLHFLDDNGEPLPIPEDRWE